MQQQNVTGLDGWVDFLSGANLPVLKQTSRDLAALHQDENKLSARTVAQTITVDPMMTVKLLRYLQQNKRRSQTSEVLQVEQALIMLGVEAFFNKIPAQPTVQDLLNGQMDALVHLLHGVHRAHRASEYAYDWAVRLNDLHYEEVRVAALLHDLAEILMWCFAPQKMLQIRAIQKQDKTLRSRAVQEQVLGFALADLQKQLVQKWELPKLLLMLMDDANANLPRVRNVQLAVNLARHSANGWDDAALPDDYKDIGELLRISAEQAMLIVGAQAGIVCDLSKPH
ncbi:HDOD domain-containing protein [Sideroxydans lithotrophicus]|uniref:Putative signal transduction protein n=1 Tax=Sideroxydans lithotrophicus (strain ES-1) TaxID=580332 RepID=D5CRM7_SIDLE|nr:HDOD domain-containing protein [Sideroxydans lithotrophicus]ADE11613.1 putative signal transduction protein [Sideroxydans lithotrophicus ES-1]